MCYQTSYVCCTPSSSTAFECCLAASVSQLVEMNGQCSEIQSKMPDRRDIFNVLTERVCEMKHIGNSAENQISSLLHRAGGAVLTLMGFLPQR